MYFRLVKVSCCFGPKLHQFQYNALEGVPLLFFHLKDKFLTTPYICLEKKTPQLNLPTPAIDGKKITNLR
jgi:hypothetical protein